MENLLKSLDFLSYRLQMKTIQHLFFKYYVPSVQIKDFNVLIDGKFFLTYQSKMTSKYTNKLLNGKKQWI